MPREGLGELFSAGGFVGGKRPFVYGARGTRVFGGLPSEPGTSPAAHIAVSLARSMVPAGKPPYERGALSPASRVLPHCGGEARGTTGDLFRLGFADSPPMGLTGPSSLENVPWTFSRAFGPPKGEGRERQASENGIDLIRQRSALTDEVEFVI